MNNNLNLKKSFVSLAVAFEYQVDWYIVQTQEVKNCLRHSLLFRQTPSK